MVTDEVWKLPAIVNRFLSFRAAIPMAQEDRRLRFLVVSDPARSLNLKMEMKSGQESRK